MIEEWIRAADTAGLVQGSGMEARLRDKIGEVIDELLGMMDQMERLKSEEYLGRASKAARARAENDRTGKRRMEEQPANPGMTHESLAMGDTACGSKGADEAEEPDRAGATSAKIQRDLCASLDRSRLTKVEANLRFGNK